MTRITVPAPLRSSATVVAIVLLSATIGGTAVAEAVTGHAAKTKPRHKPKLTLNSADKQYISSLISGAHVAFATSATSATTAASATTATSATSAATATNATSLGGQPASAYVVSGTSGEAWHLVGAAGQPAFQGTWTDLNSGYAPAGFYVDPIGIVHLKGVIAAGTAGTLAFILPAGYRPPLGLAFAVAAGSPGPTLENVDVLSDGEVVTNGTATVVALDGIAFRLS